MEAKELRRESAGPKADIKHGNLGAIEYGIMEALEPKDEKKLIRKIDLQ
jgi:hypothetical protein